MKFRTQFNRPADADHSEKVDPVSLTMPDQSIPVEELARRFVRGLPLGGVERTPLYEGEEEDYPGMDLSKMDLIDRYEYLESRKKELDDIRRRLKKAEDSKRVDAIVKEREKARLEREASEKKLLSDSTNNP